MTAEFDRLSRIDFLGPIKPTLSGKGSGTAFPKKLIHPEKQREVPCDLVLLLHEHLLAVGFSGHNVHPDLKGRIYSEGGTFRRSHDRRDLTFFDPELAGPLDFTRKIELKAHIDLPGGFRVESHGHDRHEGLDGVGPWNELSSLHLLG